MTEKVDPAALAERLETQINGMWGLVTSHPHIVSPQFLEFLMEVAAVLRQHPQEERPNNPTWFSCAHCGTSKALEDGDLICSTCWRTRLQAPEERPDLIALEKWRGVQFDYFAFHRANANAPDLEPEVAEAHRVSAKEYADKFQLLDRVLSALRAQPAPRVAHSKSEYKRLKTMGANVLPPAERTALERTCATCRYERTEHFCHLGVDRMGTICEFNHATFGCTLWAGPQARQEQE